MQGTVSVGCFFAIGWRQTGQFLRHIFGCLFSPLPMCFGHIEPTGHLTGLAIELTLEFGGRHHAGGMQEEPDYGCRCLPACKTVRPRRAIVSQYILSSMGVVLYRMAYCHFASRRAGAIVRSLRRQTAPGPASDSGGLAFRVIKTPNLFAGCWHATKSIGRSDVYSTENNTQQSAPHSKAVCSQPASEDGSAHPLSTDTLCGAQL